jgi:hypothetical protein
MDTPAVATIVISGVAAISTIAIYLDRKWGRKRRVIVKLKYAYSMGVGGNRYINVNISNPGEVTSTITSVSIGSGKDLLFFRPQDVIGYEKLPFDLEPGKSHDLYYDYEIIRESLSKYGQTHVDALCNDALGNRFDSKKMKID